MKNKEIVTMLEDNERTESNTFLHLVNRPIFNTDFTVRYSGLPQIREEALSHHITDVGLLSYVLALKMNTYGEDLNIGLILEKALLHDLDEVLTGDIPRSTKYYSESGLEAMQGIAEDAMMKLAESIDGGQDIMTKWKDCKSGKEGQVLKLADMLCVTRKVISELGVLNNGYFLKVAFELFDYLEELNKSFKFSEFSEESGDFVRSLISDSREVLKELLDRNEFTFERYGIKKNLFSKYDKIR